MKRLHIFLKKEEKKKKAWNLPLKRSNWQTNEKVQRIIQRTMTSDMLAWAPVGRCRRHGCGPTLVTGWTCSKHPSPMAARRMGHFNGYLIKLGLLYSFWSTLSFSYARKLNGNPSKLSSLVWILHFEGCIDSLAVVVVQPLSRVQLFSTPWTAARWLPIYPVKWTVFTFCYWSCNDFITDIYS